MTLLLQQRQRQQPQKIEDSKSCSSSNDGNEDKEEEQGTVDADAATTTCKNEECSLVTEVLFGVFLVVSEFLLISGLAEPKDLQQDRWQQLRF